MKYLCLVYHDAGTDLENMDEQDFNEIISEVHACLEELKSRGNYIEASPLQPPDTASTVRLRRGALSITDGPFIETKEHLAGFYLIEARDLNEAVRLVSKTPSARLGSIELRPLQELAFRD